MPFSAQKFFSSFIYFFNFYYCFFMTGAGRYAPALANDTLHAHTSMESTVHIYVPCKKDDLL